MPKWQKEAIALNPGPAMWVKIGMTVLSGNGWDATITKSLIWLCRTDEIAAKLFQLDQIRASDLERIQKEDELFQEKRIASGHHTAGWWRCYQVFHACSSGNETVGVVFLNFWGSWTMWKTSWKYNSGELHRTLVAMIDPNSGLLDRLFQSECLSNRLERLQKLCRTRHAYEKNQVLLSLMMRKPLSLGFNHFLEALNATYQSHISELLDSKKWKMSLKKELNKAIKQMKQIYLN